MNKARVILIGCGPHAKRIYLPSMRHLQHIELCLIVDLESEESHVRAACADFSEAEFWFIPPFEGDLPAELARRLSNFVSDKEIRGVIIATEPVAHRSYGEWALSEGLSILMDKPITARTDVTSKLSSAEGILKDYEKLLDQYRQLQQKKETIFMVNSQRRFHRGFQFVQDRIREIGERTNCPVTFIQAYHSDGQWRLPGEIVTQEYHPYCFGYGKASHSGYHIFDTIYQMYRAAGTTDKFADRLEFSSSFIQPNGFLRQITETDYTTLFGERYNSVKQWTDEELRHICKDYGEIDLSSIISLKKNGETIANFSVNLIHNGFACRTWIRPGQDLYKGNGRVKHESYHIQQGPFQCIQIHAYQAYDKHDNLDGPEDYLGGKNHFDVYVFRNPMVADSAKQPSVYNIMDIMAGADMVSDSMITMEWAKYAVAEEFADYLAGRKDKAFVRSQIEDHAIPVQIMSGIYRSHILRQEGSPSLVDSPFGPVQSYAR